MPLAPRTHPPLLCPGHLLRGFLTVSTPRLPEYRAGGASPLCMGAFIVLTRCKRPFLLRMANGFAMPVPLGRGAGGRSTAERYWGNSDLCKLPAKRRCGHASQSAWGFSFFAPYLSRCASGAHLSYSKCADFLQELPALLQLRTGAHHANRGSFSHLIKRIRQGG